MNIKNSIFEQFLFRLDFLLFHNIGLKIKKFAKFPVIITIVSCALITLFSQPEQIFLRILLSLLLCSLVWLTSLTLYAFGHLLDNTDKMVKYLSIDSNKDDKENESAEAHESDKE